MNFSSKNWFHGTNVKTLQFKLQRPTVSMPFFVTDSIDYAIRYSNEKTQKHTAKIVVFSLSKRLKVFDFSNDAQLKMLKLPYFVRQLLADKVEVVNVINTMMLAMKILKTYARINNIKIDDEYSITKEQLDKILNIDDCMRVITDEMYMLYGKKVDEVKDIIYELIEFIRDIADASLYKKCMTVFLSNSSIASSSKYSMQESRKCYYDFFAFVFQKIVDNRFNAYVSYEQDQQFICLGILNMEPFNDTTGTILTIEEAKRKFSAIEEQKDLTIPFRGSKNQRILKRGKDF